MENEKMYELTLVQTKNESKFCLATMEEIEIVLKFIDDSSNNAYFVLEYHGYGEKFYMGFRRYDVIGFAVKELPYDEKLLGRIAPSKIGDWFNGPDSATESDVLHSS